MLVSVFIGRTTAGVASFDAHSPARPHRAVSDSWRGGQPHLLPALGREGNYRGYYLDYWWFQGAQFNLNLFVSVDIKDNTRLHASESVTSRPREPSGVS